jgi:hypothetical protein
MDPSEDLVDAFKAAALCVTKLYKTSLAGDARARTEGYQECLDDLLSFLDRENIGLGDGEGWRVRSWATERLTSAAAADRAREAAGEGGEAMVQDRESEDEADKAEGRYSSPELTRVNSRSILSERGEGTARDEGTIATTNTSTSATGTGVATTPMGFSVPSQEHFTFQSSVSYPEAPNLAGLNLSDAHSSTVGTPPSGTAPAPTTNPGHVPRRGARHGPRNSTRTGGALGRGAGAKRKINFAEIFDLGSINNGKDMFGGGKRSRHL